MKRHETEQSGPLPPPGPASAAGKCVWTKQLILEKLFLVFNAQACRFMPGTLADLDRFLARAARNATAGMKD